ncbi:hypothetical protein [Leisingera daeponensis]|uniref:hypothetical protein n=1 Tax=Leisingera daeponensis TaxID=405746 RepID=UPI001C96DE6B|nr:hypothetical protein [Leisingera daeponensis]MBY6058649.1 hypothetical protein [Leisingera daeponensis]
MNRREEFMKASEFLKDYSRSLRKKIIKRDHEEDDIFNIAAEEAEACELASRVLDLHAEYFED